MLWQNFYINNLSPWGIKPTSLVRDQVTNLKPGSVLDVGGGDGKNAIFIAQHGFDVSVVDKDEMAHKLCNEREQSLGVSIQHHEADLEDWRSNEQYDNVLMLWVLHYLPHVVALDLIAILQSKTTPGGVHLIATFTNQGGLEKEVPGNFYPEAGVLTEIYNDWEVLDYRIRWGGTIRGILQQREYLAFRKR